MSLKVKNFFLLVMFVVLASVTSNVLWDTFGWRILPQIVMILIIAFIGEHLISSQGYYHYTRQERNGPFLRNVPLWILFLWVFAIQSSLLVALGLGMNGLSAFLISGWFTSLADFVLLEPLMSRMMELWRWTPVERGYFGFIPTRFNRFTAPPGNYIAWLIFPIFANCFLGITLLIL
ncbi:MAG: hypothetical protein ACFFCX_07190 [Candidatus Sifarchaeia archaeon]